MAPLETQSPNPPLYHIELAKSERRMARLEDDLIATVGHELRTPLGAVRGALELLSARLPRLETRERELLDMALRNSERLLRLLNDLLDAERLESGVVELERVPLSAHTLLAQARDLTGALAQGAAVRIAVAPAEPDLRVLADPDRVGQVLTNLVGNALKFAPPGSTVQLGAARERDGVRFTVRDDGPGIPLDQQERIFERFVQLHRADARDRAGSGLGLAIARSIVRQHGGRMGVVSEEGRGSLFWFVLPTG